MNRIIAFLLITLLLIIQYWMITPQLDGSISMPPKVMIFVLSPILLILARVVYLFSKRGGMIIVGALVTQVGMLTYASYMLFFFKYEGLGSGSNNEFFDDLFFRTSMSIFELYRADAIIIVMVTCVILLISLFWIFLKGNFTNKKLAIPRKRIYFFIGYILLLASVVLYTIYSRL